MQHLADTSLPGIYLYRRILQAKLFIDDNYHGAINLDDIADEACFSKYHFIRLFKTVYGKTPHQYLIMVRIEKARLLLQKGVTVTGACYEVGFDSVTSFSALFKKIMNLSPVLYRQQQLKRNVEMRQSPLKFIPNCFAQQKGWVKNSNFQ